MHQSMDVQTYAHTDPGANTPPFETLQAYTGLGFPVVLLDFDCLSLLFRLSSCRIPLVLPGLEPVFSCPATTDYNVTVNLFHHIIL